MTSMSQVVKAVVLANIDHDYITECGGTLEAVYNSEYGYNGLTSKACKDYLQGLPSVCTIPFSNFEILELLKAQGIERKTEKAKDTLIQKYWEQAGQEFYRMVKYGIK
ncbi:hypothetical protein D3C85_1227440 [compost metagenome]